MEQTKLALRDTWSNKLKKLFKSKESSVIFGVLKSPVFLFVLFLKLLSSYFLASNYPVNLFIPFIKYFSFSGVDNVYQIFFNFGQVNSFPYPALMLWITSVPFLIFKSFLSINPFIVSNLDIFLFRLPIILADVVILLILVNWFKNKQKSVLFLYWCSPVLFYINYIHGQLDVIPFAFLFVFLFLLFREYILLALVFLGLAISVKTGMVIVLPFVFIYLAREKSSYLKSFLLSSVPPVIFLVLNIFYLQSIGFIEMVLKTKEGLKVFDLFIRYNDHLVLYIIPLAYLLLLIRGLFFKKYSRDLFMTFLGFSFGILTLFISPLQGWYYWVIPFLIYFYLRSNNQGTKIKMFYLLNVVYFLYFLIIPVADISQVFNVNSGYIFQLPNLYQYLSGLGINVDVPVNLAFTLLQGVLAFNIFSMYFKGVDRYLHNKIYYKPYLIGVAGDSGSGKSSFANLMSGIFRPKYTSIVEGDDMHKWERGDEMWKEYTHLDPKANNLHNDIKHVYDLKNGNHVYRNKYDHSTGKFTLPKKLESKRVVIFEGLHSFFIEKVRKAFDLKVFISPDEDLRLHWKIIRDLQKRGHSKEDVLQQIKDRVEDSEKYIKVQEKYSDITITLKNKFPLSNRIGDEEVSLDLLLSISCTNNIDLQKVVDTLSSYVAVDYSIKDDKQIISFSGDISSETVSSLAYDVVPELNELSLDNEEWQSGYNGIIQLFVAFYIFESMKLEKYEGQ